MNCRYRKFAEGQYRINASGKGFSNIFSSKGNFIKMMRSHNISTSDHFKTKKSSIVQKTNSPITSFSNIPAIMFNIQSLSEVADNDFM